MTIFLAAGGTGGHTLPALAFAKELMKDNIQTVLISDARGMRNLVSPEGLHVHLIPLRFYQKRGIFYKILGIAELLFQALKIIFYFFKVKPKAVIGFGGFPSFPPLAAAWVLRIPYMLHEQNAILGRVNRLFLKRASRVFVSFAQTKGVSNSSHVGNPVGDLFLESDIKPKKTQKKTILIMGGSQGASIFSRVIPEGLSLLPERLTDHLHIYQQARFEDLESLKNFYKDFKVKSVVESFFSNVPDLLKEADIIVCRAGASTLAELMAMNKKALLIPYPFAMDNHQKMNAQIFVEMGYGWMILDNEFTPQVFANWLEKRLTSENDLPETMPFIADLKKMKKELNTMILEKQN